MYCAGKVICMTGGHGWQEGIEADGKDACLKAVRTQLKSGVDLIKMMATGGVMTKGVEPGNAQLSVEEIKQEEKRLHMPKVYKVLKTPYMQVLIPLNMVVF